MASQPAPPLVAPCQQALAMLEQALHLSPLEVGREVDDVEKAVAQLRDVLIHQLRQDESSPLVPRRREALSRINAVLSLIVGIEYPATGIQRAAIQQARNALAQLLAEGLLREDMPGQRLYAAPPPRGA